MNQLMVRHAGGEYPILIGAGLLDQPERFQSFRNAPVLIVTDENVASLWLNRVQTLLPGAETLTLPAGEAHKHLATVSRIWDRLAEIKAGRDALLVALGGGVVGDMTGFAAACWMRGVRFLQIPTTLLAQVDASVGGKTGVDHPAGKNLIGAFHQPEAVIIDTGVLATLPEREFAAGLAEVVKAALIADAEFLHWLETHAGSLRERDAGALAHAIRRSCEIKADIVSRDEKERGQRALLNLGHTFGHALETVTNYRILLHGEAVALGLLLAARLSETCCGLDADLRRRLAGLFERLGLPRQLPAGIEPHALLTAMQLDKKHRRAVWRLIVLDRPGHAVVREFKDHAPILAVLEDALRKR